MKSHLICYDMVQWTQEGKMKLLHGIICNQIDFRSNFVSTVHQLCDLGEVTYW